MWPLRKLDSSLRNKNGRYRGRYIIVSAQNRFHPAQNGVTQIKKSSCFTVDMNQPCLKMAHKMAKTAKKMLKIAKNGQKWPKHG